MTMKNQQNPEDNIVFGLSRISRSIQEKLGDEYASYDSDTKLKTLDDLFSVFLRREFKFDKLDHEKKMHIVESIDSTTINASLWTEYSGLIDKHYLNIIENLKEPGKSYYSSYSKTMSSKMIKDYLFIRLIDNLVPYMNQSRIGYKPYSR